MPRLFSSNQTIKVDNYAVISQKHENKLPLSGKILTTSRLEEDHLNLSSKAIQEKKISKWQYFISSFNMSAIFLS